MVINVTLTTGEDPRALRISEAHVAGAAISKTIQTIQLFLNISNEVLTDWDQVAGLIYTIRRNNS